MAETDIADLVQENCPAVRQLKASNAIRPSILESAPFTGPNNSLSKPRSASPLVFARTKGPAATEGKCGIEGATTSFPLPAHL